MTSSAVTILELSAREREVASNALRAMLSIHVDYPAEIKNFGQGQALLGALYDAMGMFDSSGRIDLIDRVREWMEPTNQNKLFEGRS